jgi:apolipoprotein N-acyltransferase
VVTSREQSGRLSTLLALLSGGLLAASFPKFGTPALAWIALAPLIVAVVTSVVDRRSAVHIFRLGVLSGLVYFGGTLYWVVGVMSTYGGLSTIVSAMVALLLASYLALYVGAFALVIRFAVRRAGLAGVWLAPFFWVALEWTRSTIGGGFPWALLGSSQASVIPVVQAASVVGVYGLSAIVALVATAAAAVALSPARPQRLGAAGVVVLLALTVTGGFIRVSRGAWTAEGEIVRAGLVQGSVDQGDKHNPALRDIIIGRYLDLSRQVIGQGAGIVIWPESATPFPFQYQSQRAAPVRRLAVEAETPFIIGTDDVVRGGENAPDRYYNAAVFVGSDGASRGLYRKMQLVPFGEYVPMKRLLFFVGPLIESVSDFSAGDEAVVFDADGRRMSVAICYESVYPWIARAFVQRGSQLLVTITIDAWFGRSSAAYQHFEQGALRAVEQGRYLVRAANTGFSGAVDPYGRVLARTDLFVPAAVAVDVRLISSRTIYSRFGDIVVWVSLAITALVLIAWRADGPTRPKP